MADANYNIMAMINSAGFIAQRHESTPYGERTVYLYNAWRVVRGDMNGDGDVAAPSAPYPPAIAPSTISGSPPEATSFGNGASGGSWERSSPQA